MVVFEDCIIPLSFCYLIALKFTCSEGRSANIPRTEKDYLINGRVLPSTYLDLPVYTSPGERLLEAQRFSPVYGSGKESLSTEIQRFLLQPKRPSVRIGAPGHPVETWCGLNKIHVRVDSRLFGEDHPQLLLGTCKANNSTMNYIYFEYDLDTCGTKRQVTSYQVSFSNTLQYNPPIFNGPIRRAVPFSLPVVCYYKRFQYSYKIGFKPKLQLQKIYKSVTNKAKFILTARNDKWERLFPSDQYLLGQPMYFEAEALISSEERLYIHSCRVTPDKSHISESLTVVNNFGCMVESKENHSRFIPYKNNIVRLTLDAFLFKGMENQQLFMHCNMSVGSSLPSPTAKSCNYDAQAQRWLELYGSAFVCNCCDYSCSSIATENQTTKTISTKPWTIKPEVKTIKAISTKPWTVQLEVKTIKNQKKPTLFTTATIAATHSVKEGRVTSKPNGRAGIRKGELENMMEITKVWPHSGQVTWMVKTSVAKEKKLKSSSVEQEKKKEEKEEMAVTLPRLIFEDLFDFGK